MPSIENVQRASLAHVDLVHVELEDLPLRVALLEFDGDHHLRHLARVGFFRRQEKPTRDLHGKRGKSLAVSAAAQVRQCRRDRAPIVDAAVVEEPPVLDRDDRIHQARRDLVIGDEASF
jgi:hypothetical protein